MNVIARLGLFVAVLGSAFGVAFAAGAVTDPIAPTEESAGHGGMGEGDTGDMADMAGMGQGGGRGGESFTAGAGVTLPGLAVSEQGYTLRPSDVTLPSGGAVEFEFAITGPDGEALRDYRPTHEKEMHLIVVRRDLAAFQHLHPTRDDSGEWTAAVNLAAAGTYRMYADFAPAALEDTTLTLGVDTFVPGQFVPVELPAPGDTDSVDGYQVSLTRSPEPGEESELSFTVTRAGTPVTDIEPYLAAFGHLVALRSGDLAYLHTHPDAEASAGQRGGPEITFGTTFPTAGEYRLFLNFAHAGQVRTAEFTVDVPGDAESSPVSATSGSNSESTDAEPQDMPAAEPTAPWWRSGAAPEGSPSVDDPSVEDPSVEDPSVDDGSGGPDGH